MDPILGLVAQIRPLLEDLKRAVDTTAAMQKIDAETAAATKQLMIEHKKEVEDLMASFLQAREALGAAYDPIFDAIRQLEDEDLEGAAQTQIADSQTERDELKKEGVL